MKLIAATTTKTGLEVQCELDPSGYEKGRKVSDDEMQTIKLRPHRFHGEMELHDRPPLIVTNVMSRSTCSVTSPKGRTLATASLRVRSGSWPRRLEEGEGSLIGHVLLDQHCLAPFGSSIAEPDDGATRVSGALLDNEARLEAKGRADMPAPMPIRPGVLVEDVEMG